MGPQPPGCLGGGRRALRPHLLPSVISDEVRYVNPSRRVSGAPPRITARGGRRLLGTRPSARPARTAARPLAARHRELPRRAAGRLRSPSSVLRLGTGEKACLQRAGRPPGLLSLTGKGRRSCSPRPWGRRSAFAPALRTRCRWKITCPISLRRVAQGTPRLSHFVSKYYRAGGAVASGRASRCWVSRGVFPDFFRSVDFWIPRPGVGETCPTEPFVACYRGN